MKPNTAQIKRMAAIKAIYLIGNCIQIIVIYINGSDVLHFACVQPFCPISQRSHPKNFKVLSVFKQCQIIDSIILYNIIKHVQIFVPSFLRSFNLSLQFTIQCAAVI